MHFYPGTPMHLFSGVDTTVHKCAISSPWDVLRLAV
jgi:hypothetical protein